MEIKPDDVKAQDIATATGRRGRKAFAGVSAAFDRIDKRSVVGLCLVIFALLIVSYPATGTVGWMAAHGISPRGYAVWVGFFGALILRLPRSRFYALAATLALLPYFVASYLFIIESDLTLIPVLLYVLLAILIVGAD